MSTAGVMDCLAFERLLDEGTPHRLSAPALAHARECARCERSLARARSLERALEREFTSEPAPADAVPAGFTDRVLARVEKGEARGVRWLALPEALPWWVRAAADPAALLAFGVAALIVWRGEQLLLSARTWHVDPARAAAWLADATRFSGLDAVAGALAAALLPAGGTPWAATGVVLGLVPVCVLLSIAGWRAGERLVLATAA